MLTIDIEATFKLIGLVLFFGYFIGFWITIHIPQEDKNRPVVFDPKKVEENIRSPRLTSRTGRFASSVRITDVTQTPKGFPSPGRTIGSIGLRCVEIYQSETR